MNLTEKFKNFPHIYYVNLDNRIDRKKYMENQFYYWKLDFTRVSGSKFLASELKEWGHEYVVGKVSGIPAYALGNALTHLEFMKQWINSNDDEYLLLMEDDYDLNLFEYWNFTWEYLMDRLPYDWDCIQLGFESEEFIPFFLHPKLRHSYFGPVLMRRDYVEKILDLHCSGDKYRFDKTVAIDRFNLHSTTVDYFIGHTRKTYSIPLITTNDKSTSTEFSIEITRLHHTKSRCAYYYWWMKEHLNYSLDDFFTYGKPNDHKMILTTY
jgi:hypothetical protein